MPGQCFTRQIEIPHDKPSIGVGETHGVMVLCFATMSLALASTRFGPRWLALVALVVGLALSAGLFLSEIHSPDDGFRMPWLQG